jgi:hypothetical protein
MDSGRHISTFKRGLSLQAAVALLLFLVLSAPHRVHHSFEQFTAPQSIGLASANVHDHGDSRHENHAPVPPFGSQQNDCAVLAATQNAHSLAALSFDFTPFIAAVEHTQLNSTESPFSFNFAPRSQRAPPLV